MKRLVEAALRTYKRWISPMLPHACRFLPTCSEYALEAVEHYGIVRGCRLAIARLLRCHPLARAGYDPVPSATLSSECGCDGIGSAAIAAVPKPMSRQY